ncbi:MAG: VanZ family protein, partial [Bacteroidota bacterium]
KTITIHILTIGFVLFIGFIIIAANTGTNLAVFKLFKAIPMGDKLAHFCLVGMLAFLINLSLKNRSFPLFSNSILLGSALVFCFITLEEFSQIWLANRDFELLDLTCNYLGIFVASWLTARSKLNSVT